MIFSFYYNYVLLEPILWSLFGVLFSYVALYPIKLRVLRALVYILGPRDRSVVEEESDDDEPCSSTSAMILHAMGQYLRGVLRVALFAIIPSGGEKESSVYFSLLFRLMLAHLYSRTVVRYFPETTGMAVKLFITGSVLVVSGFFLSALRRSVVMTKKKSRLSTPVSPESAVPVRSWTGRVLVAQDYLGSSLEWVRVRLARVILPHAHLISTILVLSVTFSGIFFIGIWTVYAFSDEVVYIYRNIAKLVRALNQYLSHFASYTTYVNRAYQVLSGWISSAVMADSASTKTRALYHYFSGGLDQSQSACTEDLAQLGNATRAITAIMNQDLETLMEDPYCLVSGFWELTEFYRDELQAGGSIARGGDYLLTLLNFFKDILMHSSSISFAAIGSGVTIFTFLFDSVLQAFIYITVLFLLLQSNVGLYRYAAVMLHFVDPSQMLYRSIHKALRAILISSIKMAVFHACFVYLLFSFFECPLVVIPTVAAFILGMVPVISPVVVAAIPLPIFAYANGDLASAMAVFFLCFLVWWFVGTAIYAEIPDSSVWVTTFSVGLGISLFGPRGVVIGPAIATIPFALYSLGSSYINGKTETAARNSSAGGSMQMIIPRLLSSPSLRRGVSSATSTPIRSEERSFASHEDLDQLIIGSGESNAENDRKKLFDFINTSSS